MNENNDSDTAVADNISVVPAKKISAVSDMSQAMSISSPKLSKTGYICIPSISCLQLLSEAELSMVPNFSISREGYGKVKWDGFVDLRGADLDSIVRIEHKSITIHGTELNRSKILTIENIFPKRSDNKTDHEKF